MVIIYGLFIYRNMHWPVLLKMSSWTKNEFISSLSRTKSMCCLPVDISLALVNLVRILALQMTKSLISCSTHTSKITNTIFNVRVELRYDHRLICISTFSAVSNSRSSSFITISNCSEASLSYGSPIFLCLPCLLLFRGIFYLSSLLQVPVFLR